MCTYMRMRASCGGCSDSDPDVNAPPPPTLPPNPPLWDVHFVEVVWTTFGPNLVPKALDFFFWYMVGVYFALCV